eukprot:TRINITY_DN3969_c0_g1_i1.p1 TRINITY_DN3969_c0_g1~~TRINITY_DN3969_c0_g1_i1.p1  ORF type:complete len:572 (-),score=137.66 TRINITY_DN3969_c0_g1_i1:139-1854(-)
MKRSLPPPSNMDALQEGLNTLRSKQAEFAVLSLNQKIKLLKEVRASLLTARPLFETSVINFKETKQTQAEWAAFIPPITRYIDAFIATVQPVANAQAAGKNLDTTMFYQPSVPEKVGDQFKMRVMPFGISDALGFNGVTADVYVQPGKALTQGKELLEHLANVEGGVALVLGAGNTPSIGFLDVLHFLFVENKVTFYKHNPVASWNAPWYDLAFGPLVKKGYVICAEGGAAEGQYLVDRCDCVHMTGSARVHDIIVWGRQDKTDPKAKPQLTKPMTSELGCVTPEIICPGVYSDTELDYLAATMVGAATMNCGFLCLSAKVMVTSKSWPQRDKFLNLVRKYFAAEALQKAYYPGAKDRLDGFADKYKDKVEYFGTENEDKEKLYFPWQFIPNLDSNDADSEYALVNEPWSGMLSEVTVDETDADFFPAATKLANERMWGTLSCSVWVCDSAERQYKKEFDQLVADLRYGSIGINTWSILSYGNSILPWGAFPGHTLEDIGSGMGFVHNAVLIDNIQKAVIRAPLNMLLGIRFPWVASCNNKDNIWDGISNREISPNNPFTLAGFFYQFMKS